METRKFIATTAVSATVLIGVLFAVFSQTRPAIESIPVDWGWAGFVFILANGFFLSYLIINKKIGSLDRLLLTVGLGFGLTFVVMILIGVLWQITLPSVLFTQVALFVALAALALRRGLKLPKFTLEPNLKIKKLHLLQVLLIMIIGVLAFAAIYDALSLPPTEWDSLAYGVNYAKIIFQNSRIPLIAGPSIGIEMSAPYPPGMQLSATFLYAFAGSANDFYYRILSPIFGLATLLVVYKFARQITQNRTAAVFAASALSLIPFFWQLFIQDTYLMALTFMLTISGYFFYKAYTAKTGDPKNYEVLGILFCSFAALTSYIGLLAFGVPLLYALHKRAGLKKLAGLVGLGVLVGLPWYLRNLVLLGNPFYPFGGGKYLDPLLHSSTSQSFQQYLQLPEYALTSTLCKMAAVLLVFGVVFFTLSKKRRNFPLTLTIYALSIGISLMGVYVAFPRYIIVAIPMAAVFFSFAINAIPENSRWLKTAFATLVTLIRSIITALPPSAVFFSLATKTAPKKCRLPQIASGVFIAFVILSSIIILPYVNTVKPNAADQNKANYIASVFEEGGAWQWINENTPANTKIATFDIKEYYLNRTMFSLDSNDAAPLYQIDNIEEAIQFLTNNGVGYFLSVPWASPMDPRMPQAYNWCIFTQYLGDLSYLPPVYVDGTGTAVYHVGALNESDVDYLFSPKAKDIHVVAPLRHRSVPVNLTFSNTTHIAACYIPFPVDYRPRNTTDKVTGNITVSLSSTNPPATKQLFIELWNDKIPDIQLYLLHPKEDPPNGPYIISNSPETFSWHIDQAGYFTIRVIGQPETESVTLDVQFDFAWD